MLNWKEINNTDTNELLSTKQNKQKTAITTTKRRVWQMFIKWLTTAQTVDTQLTLRFAAQYTKYSEWTTGVYGAHWGWVHSPSP